MAAAVRRSDGYEQLSREELIELLRHNDLQAANYEKQLEDSGQRIDELNREISRLKTKNELQSTVIENNDTIRQNTLTELLEMQKQGLRLTEKDFCVSPGQYSYQAKQLEQLTLSLARQLVDLQYRYKKDCIYRLQSASEKNVGALRPQEQEADAARMVKPEVIAGQASTNELLDDYLQQKEQEQAEAEALEDELGAAEAELEDNPEQDDERSEVTLNAADGSPADEEAAGSGEKGQDKAPAKVLGSAELKELFRKHDCGRSSQQILEASVSRTAAYRAEQDQKERAAGPAGQPQSEEAPADENGLSFLEGRSLSLGGVMVSGGSLEDTKIECWCSRCGKKTEHIKRGMPKRGMLYMHGTGLTKASFICGQVSRVKCTVCGKESEIPLQAEGDRRLIVSPPLSGPQTPLHAAAGASGAEAQAAAASASSAPAAPSAPQERAAQAWLRCGFKAYGELNRLSDPKLKPGYKVKNLLTTSEVPAELNRLHEQAYNVPAAVSAEGRQELSLKLLQEGTCCYARAAYIEDFMDKLKSYLKQAPEQHKQLQQRLRSYNEWTVKLLAAAQKVSPAALVRSCDAQDSFIKTADGVEVINPYQFDAEAYSFTPLFAGAHASTGLIITMCGLLSELSLPKSRIYRLFRTSGLDIEKQQAIKWMLGFARAYMRPASRKIKEDILHQAEAVLMDETTLKVKMSTDYIKEHCSLDPQQKQGKTPKGGMRRSQVWVMNTSWTSPIQAAWFKLSPTRSSEVPLQILKEAGPQVSYLTTDGYRGYLRALTVLKEQHGISIQHTPCWTHLRRPLHKFLDAAQLLKVYNEYLLPAGCDFYQDFADNLRKLRRDIKEQKVKVKLTELSEDLLIIYYLINSLYAVDTAVVIKHACASRGEEFKQELKEARQRCSAGIIDAIYAMVGRIIIKNPELVTVTQRGSRLTFRANPQRKEASVLVNLLTYEAEARHFIDHPEIELSESVCERSLRTGVLAKRTFYVLRSSDGGEAFCDYLTIFTSCRLNGISFFDYAVWLTANINHRLAGMSRQAGETFYVMPDKKLSEEKDEKGQPVTKLLQRYDEKNTYCYDRVDLTGLMPYDYARYLVQYKPKITSPQDVLRR